VRFSCAASGYQLGQSHYKSIKPQHEPKTKSGHNNYIGIKGYRVLGVGYSDYAESSYKDQQELPFHFVGLVVLILLNKHTKRNSTIL
jgi:hypothetical protein